jgi:hypothetical protein
VYCGLSIKDGFLAAAKIVGFFATGSLLGVGYLAYKGLQAISEESGPSQEEKQLLLRSFFEHHLILD